MIWPCRKEKRESISFLSCYHSIIINIIIDTIVPVNRIYIRVSSSWRLESLSTKTWYTWNNRTKDPNFQLIIMNINNIILKDKLIIASLSKISNFSLMLLLLFALKSSMIINIFTIKSTVKKRKFTLSL